MLIFGYDFETTGFPLFKEPSDDPRQPHVVQGGAVLVDTDTMETVSSIDLIVKPDGWIIPNETAEIHGITTDHAQKVGLPEELVVRALFELWQRSDCRVAHNQGFDARIMRIALKRFMGDKQADIWKEGEAKCTMQMATPIMKLPPSEKMRASGRRHHKSASLAEAYQFFTGREFENAHNAMADVLGCMTIFHAINAGQGAAESDSVKQFAGENTTPSEKAGTIHKGDDGELSFLD